MKNLLQYRELHKLKPGYGTGMSFPTGIVKDYIVKWNVNSILDYGCGQVDNSEKYGVDKFYRYDPVVEGIDRLPNVASVDLVLCTDVLEHIPAGEILYTLHRMRSYSKKALIKIALFPALVHLPNGENAHCSLFESEEWVSLLETVWQINVLKDDGKYLGIEAFDGC